MSAKGRNKPNKEERKKPTLRERLADSFEVSKELLLDAAKVTLIGARELTMENYTGLSEYSEDSVYVLAKPSPIRISGSCLEIKAMTSELLLITGEITEFAFEE